MCIKDVKINNDDIYLLPFLSGLGADQHNWRDCVHGEQPVRQPQVRGGGDGSLLRQVSVQVIVS